MLTAVAVLVARDATPAAAKTKSAKKFKPKMVKTAQLKVTSAGPCPISAEQSSAIDQSADAFWKHLKAGHLEESPKQQVMDIMAIDQYTKTHTVLVENMLKPLVDSPGDGSVMDQVVNTFWKHVKAGHLEESPAQQVKDIANYDQYIKTHTVLVENMIKPMLEANASGGSAIDNAVDAFWKHFKAGHLDESPMQQAADIIAIDQYTKTHTVLVQNMLAPFMDGGSSGSALDQAVDVFWKHVKAGHLQESPMQQAKDILDLDQYVKTHTVLVQNMLKPLMEPSAGSGDGGGTDCGGGDTMPMPTDPAPTTTPAPAPAAGDTTIHISGLKFPADTAVSVGSTVTWINDDSAPHTVTSMHGSELDSPQLNKGESYAHKFTTAGTFMYVCNVHPDMQATITVK